MGMHGKKMTSKGKAAKSPSKPTGGKAPKPTPKKGYGKK